MDPISLRIELDILKQFRQRYFFSVNCIFFKKRMHTIRIFNVYIQQRLYINSLFCIYTLLLEKNFEIGRKKNFRMGERKLSKKQKM